MCGLSLGMGSDTRAEGGDTLPETAYKLGFQAMVASPSGPGAEVKHCVVFN